MFTIRHSNERGHANHGWLDTYHTFSFADYYDPAHMGFRMLRVINEDTVQPGMGFGTHPHRDMEILTYVLEGRLAHKDSMGNGREIGPGQLQTMSAGTGIQHSEFNASHAEPVHFLQIWIQPNKRGLTPRYAEWNPPVEAALQVKTLLASPEGREGSAEIAQDAYLYLVRLKKGEMLTHTLEPSRAAWVQVMRGSFHLDGCTLVKGDGTAIEDETSVQLRAAEDGAEALLFDLA